MRRPSTVGLALDFCSRSFVLKRADGDASDAKESGLGVEAQGEAFE
jgi:hypothetical protein